MKLRCDAVFEGGGIKGIGFAGAITALENAGYVFENVVGTSAGAIAASLVAAGYSGREIERELTLVDYTKFREEPHCGKLGSAVNLLANYGLYKTVYFESWLQELLLKKGKRVFGDICTNNKDKKYCYRFQAIASDISAQKMLVLPKDLIQFGINPDEFPIARAVQMSMSIPFYYEPFALKDRQGNVHLIVDGGLLSGYPMWVLDDDTNNPPWPTFGLKFTSPGDLRPGQIVGTPNLLEYGKSIVSTMLEAHDKYHVSHTKGDYQRSILIPTFVQTSSGPKIIRATDFDISREESNALFQNGKSAAENFLRHWDFYQWKKLFRRGTASISANIR